MARVDGGCRRKFDAPCAPPPGPALLKPDRVLKRILHRAGVFAPPGREPCNASSFCISRRSRYSCRSTSCFSGWWRRDSFAAQVGDMLGPIRPAPAVLFYLLYIAGIVIFVSGQRPAPGRDAALWRAVRAVLLRDLRADGAVAAQALDLGGGCGRRRLGRGRDRHRRDAWRVDRQPHSAAP